MNDWQQLYVLTKDVTPMALLTMGRLRVALEDGSVTVDQAAEALTAGGEAIGALLTGAAEPAAETGGGDADTEELTESFNPFGRLI